MLPIRGVYEVAIHVRELKRSEAFYCNVLGLEPGLRDDRRSWHFLWVGGRSGMVVLQEDAGEWPLQHLAFTVDAADLDRAVAMLQERGVETRGPVYHEWMNARSLYFDDPDGHELELCAPLTRPTRAGCDLES